MLRNLAVTGIACGVLVLVGCSDGKEPTLPGVPPSGTIGSVEITPAAPKVYTGRTLSLTATVKAPDGKPMSGQAVTWTSSAPAIAKVEGNGTLTGLAEGTAKITATAGGKSAESTVTVERAPVASVKIEPGTATVGIGEKVMLTATAYDDQNNPLEGREIQWTSAKPEFATVAATGEVTGVSEGEVSITAASEGKQATAAIKVAAPVATVQVVTALDTLEAYESRTLAATLRDASGRVLTGRKVTWTSSDPTVATVDSETGVITGVDRGTVIVTATSEGKNGTASRVVVIRYRSVTAGAMHACDLASGGIAWCWGLNGRQGRIGLERMTDDEHSTKPVRVPGNHRFTQLATYGMTTCGIDGEGKAFCWGYGAWGILGNGASNNSFTPVAVSGGHTFRQLAAGPDHICGVTTGNQIYCWGNNGSGQLGNGARTSSNVPVLAAGGQNFASVTAGAEYTCAVTTAGAAYCWGYSGLGNLGDGQKISFGNTYSLTPVAVVGGHTFRQLTAGQKHTCGVTTAGQLYCWGSNSGKLGNGTGTETSTPSLVSGGLNAGSVSAGFNHSCAIATSGDLYCWGGNGNGQLGLVLLNGSNVPVKAGGSLKAAEVSAANVATGSAAFTCAVSRDRLTTFCWGRNDVGQLGNGGTTAPVAVNTNPTVVEGQRPN
jgi:alpha-tubulin suppressor-like RCC1 family protein/uncharacterized protein YjdB